MYFRLWLDASCCPRERRSHVLSSVVRLPLPGRGFNLLFPDVVALSNSWQCFFFCFVVCGRHPHVHVHVLSLSCLVAFMAVLLMSRDCGREKGISCPPISAGLFFGGVLIGRKCSDYMTRDIDVIQGGDRFLFVDCF